MQTIRLTGIILLALATGLLAGYLLWHSGGQALGSKEAVELTANSNTPTEWTCSMHPQIRQPEPGICPICEMDLIPAIGSSDEDNPLQLKMSKEAIKLAAIETIEARPAKGNQEKAVRLFGRLEWDERGLSTQVSHFSGRVEQLYVNFTGQKIEIGDKLASIYAPEMIQAQQELLEALKLRSSRPELEEAARKKLQALKAPEWLVAHLETDKMIIENLDLVADHAGVITARKVAPGDYLKTGQTVFSVANIDKLWVVLDAYEEDLVHIKEGNVIEFTADALPGRKFFGRVEFVDPIVNPQTRTVKIRGSVDNRSGLLKPDMFIRGNIRSSIAMEGETLRIPKSAVLWTGKRSVVYVRIPDSEIPVFEYREVRIADESGSDYLVVGDLFGGEQVVRQGAFTLDAAAQLNNRQSMMNHILGPGTQTSEIFDQLPIGFVGTWESTVATYMEMKDAFVASDSNAVIHLAKKQLDLFRDVQSGELPREATRLWEEEKRKVELILANLMRTPELENQRKLFEEISQRMIHLVRSFPPKKENLFVQHCPMAFNNEGADWLSFDSQIMNPYFGDKMLKCGIISETISVK